MSGKYTFSIKSEQSRFPHRVIIGQQDTETVVHVMLKFLGFMLFFRDRLQIEPNLHDDNIPFRPDVVQLDYQMRPVLWVECGECGVQKLDKLAVKVPEAELWVMKKSERAARDLIDRMARSDLRANRYHLAALPEEPFEELCSMLAPRNEVYWVEGTLDPPRMSFDFNGLWFELEFQIFRF